jgi:hypothetical protein
MGKTVADIAGDVVTDIEVDVVAVVVEVVAEVVEVVAEVVEDTVTGNLFRPIIFIYKGQLILRSITLLTPYPE